MTWKTVRGDRVLRGAEARLFAVAIPTIIDFKRDDEEGKLNFGCPLIVGPFERLSPKQQISVLEEVAIALLTETSACPELTAINERAVYYVFMWLKGQLDDFEQSIQTWGPYIAAAFDEAFPIEEGITPEDEDYTEHPTVADHGTYEHQSKWEENIER